MTKQQKYTKQVDGNTTRYLLNGSVMFEHDEKGNKIHFKSSGGYEWWSEHDEKGNDIHFKDSEGYEWWSEHDEKGNEIHFKDSNGYEWWRDDHPDNSENKPEVTLDEIKPFTFKTKHD